jgi:hypothetical protein
MPPLVLVFLDAAAALTVLTVLSFNFAACRFFTEIAGGTRRLGLPLRRLAITESRWRAPVRSQLDRSYMSRPQGPDLNVFPTQQPKAQLDGLFGWFFTARYSAAARAIFGVVNSSSHVSLRK